MRTVPTAAGLGRLLAVLGAVAASITCAGPTDSTGNPPAPPSPVASLEIAGSDTLLVHESSLLTVTARDAQGQVLVPTPAVWLTTSNPGIALASGDGVIRGVSRGTVTISARVDTVTVSRTVVVKARVRLIPAPGPTWRGSLVLAVGDSMLYTAQYIDVNGQPIGMALASDWVSSDPSAVSVNSAGWVTAHVAFQDATIRASTPDGPADVLVPVSGVTAGLPATVRLVHAVEGVGPITFRTNRAAPVTLGFGQAATLPVTSGSFQVEADGMPLDPYGWPNYYAMLGPDQSLSIYATTGRTGASLAAAWDPTDPIPGDSGMVRLIQGTFGFPVVYLLDSGAPLAAQPNLCYFDPGDPSRYYVRPAGTFDLVMRQKPGFYFDSTARYVRLPADAPAGHAVTLVLLGNTPGSAHYLAFTDR